MMKRALILAVLILLPVSVAAQENVSRSLPEGVVAPVTGSGTVFFAAQPAQTSPARFGGPTRRPSMVGYVEDSTVGTQLRIRFDTARHIHEPDRAEFFYGKCGCYRGLPTNHPFFDPNAPGDADGIATDLNAQHLYFLGEYGMMANRGSLFVELPIRWVKPPEGIAGLSQKGLSDLRLGAKFGLMATDYGQATVLVRFSTPTGDAAKGLGTDHSSLEPALLISQSLNERVGIEAQFGGIFPIGGSAGLPTSGDEKFAGRILYYGIGPSFDIYSNNGITFSPVIELVGWRLLSGFQTGNPATSTGPSSVFAAAKDVSPNIVNIKVGARLAMPTGGSLYFGWGTNLTDAAWYEDIIRVEYRMAIGR